MTYLTALGSLAASISVLNARRPGSGVWAVLIALLILVLLVPWLEGAGLGWDANPGQRLRLPAPWSLFFGLLILAGATNYLPTKYGVAAACFGVGLTVELIALTKTQWAPERRAWIWSLVPWLLAFSAWIADACALGSTVQLSSFDRLWHWFRDHWGVVWALRVRDRFNESANARAWPFRLAWHGLAFGSEREAEKEPEIVDEAEGTLKSLLRRFADAARVDAEARGGRPCQADRADG
jgi:hypothetical protein